jgi:hypothetical protein
MSKFNYDNIVKVREGAPPESRPGRTAWVVGVFENRLGSAFDAFPEGTIYIVEFEDGTAIDIHESDLDLATT